MRSFEIVFLVITINELLNMLFHIVSAIVNVFRYRRKDTLVKVEWNEAEEEGNEGE